MIELNTLRKCFILSSLIVLIIFDEIYKDKDKEKDKDNDKDKDKEKDKDTHYSQHLLAPNDSFKIFLNANH